MQGSRISEVWIVAKVGIESFLLDCHTNDNISEIEAEYGVKGFAVVVRLWQKIYCEKGYYCEWVDRSPLLFLTNWFGGNSGVTVNLITDIVERCLKNGIFNAGMYKKYSILTSHRIQEQYFDVVKRRSRILVKKEYLLISVDKIQGIVYENEIPAYKNPKNVCKNDLSKVKESKVNKNTIGRFTPPSVEEVAAYCKARNNGIIASEFIDFYAAKGWMIGKNRMKDWKAAIRTWEQRRKGEPATRGSFNSFQQNEYDFNQLEAELMSN